MEGALPHVSKCEWEDPHKSVTRRKTFLLKINEGARPAMATIAAFHLVPFLPPEASCLSFEMTYT
jgi:hypothetical protein